MYIKKTFNKEYRHGSVKTEYSIHSVIIFQIARYFTI